MFAGKPPVTYNYDNTVIDGINVYVSKNMNIRPEGIKISLSRWGIWNQLVIEGVIP